MTAVFGLGKVEEAGQGTASERSALFTRGPCAALEEREGAAGGRARGGPHPLSLPDSGAEPKGVWPGEGALATFPLSPGEGALLTRLDEQRRDTAFPGGKAADGEASAEKGFIKSSNGPRKAGGLWASWSTHEMRPHDACEVSVLLDWGSRGCWQRVRPGEPQLRQRPEAEGRGQRRRLLCPRDAHGVWVRLAALKGTFFIYRSISHPLSSVCLRTRGKTRSRLTVGLPWVCANCQREGQGGGG